MDGVGRMPSVVELLMTVGDACCVAAVLSGERQLSFLS